MGDLREFRWATGVSIAQVMTTPANHAPELLVQTWFNTDHPLLLAGLRGRVVVLCAFQVLCPISIGAGIPQAQRIYETFAPSDVTVIGLHATFEHHDAFNPAVLKAFIHEYRLKFPIALDHPNPTSPIPHTMDRYKMRGTPSLVLIDRHGMIRKHAFGPVDDLRIGAEIGALTQEAESAVGMSRSSAA
jgi:AhpC/TSA family